MKIIDSFLQENTEHEIRNSSKGLVRYGDHFLILRIRENVCGAGFWDLPGGGQEVNKKETKEEALRREVYEETNLSVSNIKFNSSKVLELPETGVKVNFTFFDCEADNTEVILKPAKNDNSIYIGPYMWSGSGYRPEHNEYKWVQYKHELRDLEMLSEFKNVLIKKLKEKN